MTAAPTNQSPQSQAAVVLHGLLTQYAQDVITSGSTILDTSLASIEANPSPSNIVAQGIALVAAAPLALPNLQADAAKQTATAGRTLLGILRGLSSGMKL